MRDAFAGLVGCERQKETIPRRATVFSTEVRLPVRVAASSRRGYAIQNMTQIAAFRAAMAARQRQVVMIRRFGPPPGRHPYRLRPGAYAVLIRDGQALLTFQHQPEPEFQLPGGGIDPGNRPWPRCIARCARKPAGPLVSRAGWGHIGVSAICRIMVSGRKNCAGFGWRGRSCAVAHRPSRAMTRAGCPCP